MVGPMSQLLVVDDDDSIRRMFATALAKLADVDQAAGGGQAIASLATKKYDAVLLDLNMAGIDGLGVLRALEDKSALNHATPVFVITAEGPNQTRHTAQNQSRYLITKPVKIGVLVTLVAGVLGKNPNKLM